MPALPAANTAQHLLDAPVRSMTIGSVALISLLAFEAMAVTTAMPVVAAQLQGLVYFPLAFGAAMAASMLGMVLSGHASDCKSPARPLVLGIAWFVGGLLIAGLATHMLAVVAGRAVMGLGIGMQSVALYACIGRVYPEHLHARIFGLFAAAWIVPAMLGPLVAGQIVEHLHWRWLFLGAPLLVLPCAWLLAPSLRMIHSHATQDAVPPAGHTRRMWLACSAALAALIVHGCSQGQTPQHTVFAALALLLMLDAGRRLLPAGVMRLGRGLPSVIALRGLCAAAFASTEIYIPLLLVQERQLTPTGAGLVLTCGALAWSAGSWLQARLPASLRREHLLSSGMAAMAIGTVLMGRLLWPDTSVAWAVSGLILSGLGIGLCFPQLSTLTLKLAPRHNQGTSVSALQLCDALTTTAALAISGYLFIAWHASNPAAAYLAIFGLAFLLAILGVLGGQRISPARTTQRDPQGRAAAHVTSS